jgi:hypothetical protein
MTAILNWTRSLRNALPPVAVAVASLGWVAPASAYLLDNTTDCHPGAKWDVSHTVTVRVLDDSVLDYARLRGATAGDVLERMNRDIDAVIKLWNSVPGSRLVFERGSSIAGDTDLEDTNRDHFGDQTIVIGFTNEKFDSDTAEAATSRDEHKCTIQRAHIRFRKNDDPKHPFYWVFGPPDDYNCNTTDTPTPKHDCRSFITKEQPATPGNTSVRTFLGILTHEMGHAVGLDHPDDNYALMAQNSRTWLRGKNEVLHTQLLPDDVSAVQALYGSSSDHPLLDISVTNTWYESDIQECHGQQVAVKKASDALDEATGSHARKAPPADSSGGGSQDSNDKYAELYQALNQAEDALQICKADHNADQVEHCRVSSRADRWATFIKPGVLCGVKDDHSVYPKVSNSICPGKQVQLRFTLNNQTNLREVLVRTEVWFSSDMALNRADGSDVQSPDLSEFTLPAASSAPVGQVFRLPAKVPADANGQTYVFVRAVPYDPKTNASLLDTETDQFNNAVMIPDYIKVDAAACS